MDDLMTGQDLLDRAALVLDVPLVRALDVRLLTPRSPRDGVSLVVQGLALNGAGGVHAAALAAVAEVAGYLALAPSLSTSEHAVSHATSMSLMAPAPRATTVVARGHLDRRTRRTAFLAVTLTVEEDLVARVQLVKSVVPWG